MPLRHISFEINYKIRKSNLTQPRLVASRAQRRFSRIDRRVRFPSPAPYGNQIQYSPIFLYKFNFSRVQATIFSVLSLAWENFDRIPESDLILKI
jgi:hypothetical protein